MIASHVNVGAALPVEITRQHTQAVALIGFRDAGSPGDIAECAIAIVVIKDVVIERQAARPAVHRQVAIPAVGIRSGFGCCGEIEFHIIRHENIELAVVVVIQERAAGVVTDAVLPQVRVPRDIFKTAPRDIMVELQAAPISD